MANDGSLPVDPKGSMVRGIFSKIADSYGTFNAVSSLGIYRSWLKVLAETAACTADEKVLDVAGGTGDVAGGPGTLRGRGVPGGAHGLHRGRRHEPALR